MTPPPPHCAVCDVTLGTPPAEHGVIWVCHRADCPRGDWHEHIADLAGESVSIWVCEVCGIAGLLRDYLAGKCWGGKCHRRPDCPLPLPSPKC